MIRFTDLLGTPWDDLNCGEVAVEGLRRMGMDEAADHVPVDQASAARLVARGGGSWEFLHPDPRKAREGQLILSDGPEQELHVSLVIGPGKALTSARRLGVYAPPVSRIAAVRGVYEFRP